MSFITGRPTRRSSQPAARQYSTAAALRNTYMDGPLRPLPLAAPGGCPSHRLFPSTSCHKCIDVEAIAKLAFRISLRGVGAILIPRFERRLQLNGASRGDRLDRLLPTPGIAASCWLTAVDIPVFGGHSRRRATRVVRQFPRGR